MTDARVKAVAKLESAVDPKLAEKIIEAVDEQSLVHMCCDVINIPSPTGEEYQLAPYIQSTLQALGVENTWQEGEEGRANVDDRWTGVGRGKNVRFMSHLVTSNTGRKDFLTGPV